MTKKRNRKLNEKFGFTFNDNRTVEEKVFDLIAAAHIDDIKDVLLSQFVGKPNDKNTRYEIEEFLNEVFQGRYIVRCSELENPQETIDVKKINIRLVGIDEDMTIHIDAHDQVQLSIDLEAFMKDVK